MLIVSLARDAWVAVAMPWALHGHGFWSSSPSTRRWREVLESSGFTAAETGTGPATRYFLATRSKTP